MAKITVIDAKGAPTEINEQNLAIAQDRGARLPTAEEQQQFADQKEYGEGIGNTLKAGALGAARVATLGISDALAADFGQREDVKKLRDYNPVASITGEIAGAVAPALLSGGSSLLAKGAGIAGKGVEGAAALGSVAEGVAAKAFGGLAQKGLGGRIAANALKKAAGGAAEGAAYGVGQAISDSALEDYDLTAEQLMQHVGTGALLGGVVGGGLGAGGEVVKAGGRAVKGAATGIRDALNDATSPIRDAFKSVMDGKASGEALKKQIKEAAEISSTLTGTSQHELEFFADAATNPARRADMEAALSGDETIMKSAEKIRDTEDKFDDLFDEIVDQGRGQGKLEGLKTKMQGVNADIAAESTFGVYENASSALDDMLADPKAFGNGAVLKKARSAMDRIQSQIEKSTEEGGDASARLYYELDNVKRDIQKLAKRASKSTSLASDRAAFEGLNDVQQLLRTHLEDTQIWGEAAVAQKEVNAAWTKFLSNEGYAKADFKTLRESREYEDIYKHDPAKWMGFFKRQGTPAATIDSEYLAARAAARDDLILTMQRHYADGLESGKKIDKLRELAKQSNEVIAETQRVSALQNRFKAIEGDGSISGTAAGALAGFSAGGLKGAIKGAFSAKALSNPQQTLRQLAAANGFAERLGTAQTVSGAARKSFDKLGESVSKFFGKAKKAGNAVKGGVSAAADYAPRAAAILGGRDVPRDNKEAQAYHREQIDQLKQMAQNPATTIDRIGQSTQKLALQNPAVAQALQSKAIATASFLLSKAPPQLQTQADMLAGRTQPIARSELARFNRYVNAASNPGAVLDDLAAGHVSVEAAETMRSLYPRTVEQIRAQVTEKIANGHELSHKQRLVLGQLFATPLASTEEPSVGAAFQANWQSGSVRDAAEQSQNQGAQKPRMTGIAKADIGNNDMTKSQRLMAG